MWRKGRVSNVLVRAYTVFYGDPINRQLTILCRLYHGETRIVPKNVYVLYGRDLVITYGWKLLLDASVRCAATGVVGFVVS